MHKVVHFLCLTDLPGKMAAGWRLAGGAEIQHMHFSLRNGCWERFFVIPSPHGCLLFPNSPTIRNLSFQPVNLPEEDTLERISMKSSF